MGPLGNATPAQTWKDWKIMREFDREPPPRCQSKRNHFVVCAGNNVRVMRWLFEQIHFDQSVLCVERDFPEMGEHSGFWINSYFCSTRREKKWPEWSRYWKMMFRISFFFIQLPVGVSGLLTQMQGSRFRARYRTEKNYCCLSTRNIALLFLRASILIINLKIP